MFQPRQDLPLAPETIHVVRREQAARHHLQRRGLLVPAIHALRQIDFRRPAPADQFDRLPDAEPPPSGCPQRRFGLAFVVRTQQFFQFAAKARVAAAAFVQQLRTLPRRQRPGRVEQGPQVVPLLLHRASRLGRALCRSTVGFGAADEHAGLFFHKNSHRAKEICKRILQKNYPGTFPLLSLDFVAFNPSSSSKVLVRATNWLGDAVMSLPAIRAIRGDLSRTPTSRCWHAPGWPISTRARSRSTA